MKFGFYVLGLKGFRVLQSFIDEQGARSVSWVVYAMDKAVDNDESESIKALCRQFGLPCRERQAPQGPPLQKADVCYAIGWRWMILDDGVLVVFHDSPLPRYRGFAPLVNMLIDGADHLGVTALYASSEYDKGEILDQQVTPIAYPIKIEDAISRVIPLYVSLVSRVTSKFLRGGQVASTPQDESVASYGLWRDDDDYLLSWSWSASKIKRFIDATGAPYKGAAAILHGSLVRLLDAVEFGDVTVEGRTDSLGKVIFIEDGCPVVVCASGLLKLLVIRSVDGLDLVGKIGMRTRFRGRECQQ